MHPPLLHNTAPVAIVLSQGDEVVTGQIADTNAAFLSDQLTDLGFRVGYSLQGGLLKE